MSNSDTICKYILLYYLENNEFEIGVLNWKSMSLNSKLL